MEQDRAERLNSELDQMAVHYTNVRVERSGDTRGGDWTDAPGPGGQAEASESASEVSLGAAARNRARNRALGMRT